MKPPVPPDTEVPCDAPFQIDVFSITSSNQYKDPISLSGLFRLLLFAWHNVPAGSVPQDDGALASISGLNGLWMQFKARVLEGWALAEDRNYYFPPLVDAVTATISRRTKRLSKNSRNDQEQPQGNGNLPCRETVVAPLSTYPPGCGVSRLSEGDSVSSPGGGEESGMDCATDSSIARPASRAKPSHFSSDLVKRKNCRSQRKDLQPGTDRTQNKGSNQPRINGLEIPTVGPKAELWRVAMKYLYERHRIPKHRVFAATNALLKIMYGVPDLAVCIIEQAQKRDPQPSDPIKYIFGAARAATMPKEKPQGDLY